jgi:hypothetical protein
MEAPRPLTTRPAELPGQLDIFATYPYWTESYVLSAPRFDVFWHDPHRPKAKAKPKGEGEAPGAWLSLAEVCAVCDAAVQGGFALLVSTMREGTLRPIIVCTES